MSWYRNAVLKPGLARTIKRTRDCPHRGIITRRWTRGSPVADDVCNDCSGSVRTWVHRDGRWRVFFAEAGFEREEHPMPEPVGIHAAEAFLVSRHGWRLGVVVKDATASAVAWLWFSAEGTGSALTQEAAIQALTQREGPA